VPTNKQRRETERRRLQRQLEERREREAARKRFTMVASIVGTLVLIGAVIAIVVATTGGSTTTASGGAPTSSRSAATSSSPAATSSAPALDAPVACAKPGKSATASFDGVTVTNPTDLAHAPKVTSKATTDPTALECQDLVIGKGAAATPSSTVSVQYTGVLYKNGTQFDSSWKTGKPVSFPLTGVVPGFTQGIGGTGKVAPMRVGGRRIMILPAALGYGAQGSGPIPANAALVFVVDLKSVK
jgi:peptidylprolyl isomerase